ncbi:mechanosensitive ion channel family protein [Streptomyces armeniacus]|uniref:Mechanosensitive ion channel family protein n=1 Tax=Streptomyces armeniacus TaxID=83291 RepID=A0A345XLZ3_9ACTN|nr:mechanosensitive ion channel family protein [Streptomyces armeniacus]AXK32659.1 mechanosensitive ion channel family protein [Streptomyces armeniacus]
MEHVLRPVLVIGATIAVAVIVGWFVNRILTTADRRHPETPLWGHLRNCRLPLQVVLVSTGLQGAYGLTGIDTSEDRLIKNILALITIAALVWLAVRTASAIAETALARFASTTRDPARVRRFRTQLTMIQRVVTFVLATIAAAVAILLLFPGLKALGASMLASAGVIGIVAGVAAQSMLGNLFAGLQVAFGDSVRIGDTVVVEGEWGTVEEISMAFLTVRIWDDRRLTMPVSYFNSKPYENWSRGGNEITCTVYLHLDHSAPVQEMREKLHSVLKTREDWDRRSWNLVVTDTTPTTIEVRAAMSAKDTDDWWTLQCGVREELITWLQREHPYALPRVATSPAAVPPPRDAAPAPRVGTQGGPTPGEGPGEI